MKASDPVFQTQHFSRIFQQASQNFINQIEKQMKLSHNTQIWNDFESSVNCAVWVMVNNDLHKFDSDKRNNTPSHLKKLVQKRLKQKDVSKNQISKIDLEQFFKSLNINKFKEKIWSDTKIRERHDFENLSIKMKTGPNSDNIRKPRSLFYLRLLTLIQKHKEAELLDLLFSNETIDASRDLFGKIPKDIFLNERDFWQGIIGDLRLKHNVPNYAERIKNAFRTIAQTLPPLSKDGLLYGELKKNLLDDLVNQGLVTYSGTKPLNAQINFANTVVLSTLPVRLNEALGTSDISAFANICEKQVERTHSAIKATSSSIDDPDTQIHLSCPANAEQDIMQSEEFRKLIDKIIILGSIERVKLHDALLPLYEKSSNGNHSKGLKNTKNTIEILSIYLTDQIPLGMHNGQISKNIFESRESKGKINYSEISKSVNMDTVTVRKIFNDLMSGKMQRLVTGLLPEIACDGENITFKTLIEHAYKNLENTINKEGHTPPNNLHPLYSNNPVKKKSITI